MITGDEQADPKVVSEYKTHPFLPDHVDVKSKGGLTILQKFSVSAMQGILANKHTGLKELSVKEVKEVGTLSVQMAQSLIDALNAHEEEKSTKEHMESKII